MWREQELAERLCPPLTPPALPPLQVLNEISLLVFFWKKRTEDGKEKEEEVEVEEEKREEVALSYK